jgi:poly[(R)-3-hydroxyalkanoate] polymerase subunit PhaC
MEQARQRAPARLGPRPLPYHLLLAATTWLGSPPVLPPSRNGSPASNPDPPESHAALAAALAKAAPGALAAAISSEARRRLGRLLDGIEAYRRHPYERRLAAPPALWQEGTTRLLDYRTAAAGRGPAVLVVPSLINRAYILDLTAETSLMRFLAAAGCAPFLVDWDAPGEAERGFTLTDYVAGRLEAALDQVRAATGRPVVLLGYCMGGLLTLALAARRAADLAGAVFLATPWDFHAERPDQARLLGASSGLFEPTLAALGELPVDLIQLLFAGLDPFQVIRKFLDFATLDAASPRARLFVALEDWLNDGVPLAAAVARDCLAGWYGANSPAAGSWRIAGRPVRPGDCRLPSLAVIPDHDRIVPPRSALALAEGLPQVETLRPVSGHIGMVVGAGAEERLRQPLAAWLLRRTV